MRQESSRDWHDASQDLDLRLLLLSAWRKECPVALVNAQGAGPGYQLKGCHATFLIENMLMFSPPYSPNLELTAILEHVPH